MPKLCTSANFKRKPTPEAPGMGLNVRLPIANPEGQRDE